MEVLQDMEQKLLVQKMISMHMKISYLGTLTGVNSESRVKGDHWLSPKSPLLSIISQFSGGICEECEE